MKWNLSYNGHHFCGLACAKQALSKASPVHDHKEVQAGRMHHGLPEAALNHCPRFFVGNFFSRFGCNTMKFLYRALSAEAATAAGEGVDDARVTCNTIQS